MHRNIFALKSGAIQVGLALFAAGISFAAPATVPTMGEQAALDAIANNADTTILPPVTVAAHSFGVPVQNTGVSVTKISTEKMEEQGIYTVDDALRRVPGAYVANQEGQRGSSSTVRLRGLNSSSYTLTVVDGIRISDSNMTGSSFMGTQSLLGFQEVEVVRGPEGAVFGAQAVGGIISFNLPTGKGDPSLRLFAEGGSFGSFTGAVIAQGEVGQLAYYIMGGYETTQNDPQYPRSPYLNDPGYADYSQWFEAAKFVLSLNEKSKVNFSFRRSDNTYERPEYDPEVDYGWGPSGTNMIYRSKDKYDFTFFSASYEAELTKLWSTELLAGYYENNFDEYASGMTMMGDYGNEYKKWQVEWKNQLRWNDQWRTTLGTAWDRAEYTQYGATPANNTDTENIIALYAEQFYSPLEGLDFSVAGRWEHYERWSNQFSWRFGSSWQVTGKDSPTRLFATVGTGFQAPSLIDLGGYGDPNGWNYWSPNPDLDPTEAIGYDLGIEQKLDKYNTLKVTGFYTHLKDIIVTNSSYTQRINNGKADSYGVEVALSGDFKDYKDTGYTIAYTYTNPIYASGPNDGKQLPATARHTISADVYTTPWDRITVGAGITAAMKRTNYDAAPNYLDGYSNVRVFARWKVCDNVTIHGRIENLLNDKYVLADEYYAPIMARRVGFFGGVTIDF